MSAPIVSWPAIGRGIITTFESRPGGAYELADIRPTAFVQELDRIMANFERPRLTVVTVEVDVEERNPAKWRGIAVRQGITGTCICPDCHGSGVVPVYIAMTDEVEFDTCMKCAHLFVGADWDHPHDDVPF